MHHRVYVGQVVSDKMDKTVVVAVPWVQRHRRYGKAMRKITKLYAHDPRGECQMGDRVRVVEVRPLSRTKRWLVKNIIYRREIVQAPELEAAVGAVVAPAAVVEEVVEADTEAPAEEAVEAETEAPAEEAAGAETEAPAAEATETETEAPAAEAAEAETEAPAAEAAEAEPEAPAAEAAEAEPQEAVAPAEAGEEQPSPSPVQGEERTS